jgi:hypothetical protein
VKLWRSEKGKPSCHTKATSTYEQIAIGQIDRQRQERPTVKYEEPVRGSFLALVRKQEQSTCGCGPDTGQTSNMGRKKSRRGKEGVLTVGSDSTHFE